jgi:hypothetical protein
MITLESIEELKEYIGKITGKSPWVNVSHKIELMNLPKRRKITNGYI